MLWRWQYLGRGRGSGPFQKAAIVVGAPVFLAYMPSILLTPHGGQGFPVFVAFLLFASMTITMAVRDPETRLTPQETTLWLWGAIGVIIVLLFTAPGRISIGDDPRTLAANRQPVVGLCNPMGSGGVRA